MPHADRNPDAPPVSATDPRYPSGPWRGVYFQDIRPFADADCIPDGTDPGILPFGMQLTLKFWSNDTFTGYGHDHAGEFTIRSVRFEQFTLNLAFDKCYRNHTIRYTGVSAWRRPGIWGHWKQGHGIAQVGGFMLWPGTGRRLEGLGGGAWIEDEVAG